MSEIEQFYNHQKNSNTLAPPQDYCNLADNYNNIKRWGITSEVKELNNTFKQLDKKQQMKEHLRNKLNAKKNKN